MSFIFSGLFGSYLFTTQSGGYQLLDDVLTMDNVDRVTLSYGEIGYELELGEKSSAHLGLILCGEDLRVYFWSIDTDMNWNISETVIFGGPPPIKINYYMKDGTVHRIEFSGIRYFFKHYVYNIVVDGTSYITDKWRIDEMGRFVEPYIEDLIEGNKEYQQQ